MNQALSTKTMVSMVFDEWFPALHMYNGTNCLKITSLTCQDNIF
jgi:hypothetical protein